MWSFEFGPRCRYRGEIISVEVFRQTTNVERRTFYCQEGLHHPVPLSNTLRPLLATWVPVGTHMDHVSLHGRPRPQVRVVSLSRDNSPRIAAMKEPFFKTTEHHSTPSGFSLLSGSPLTRILTVALVLDGWSVDRRVSKATNTLSVV